MRGAERSQRRCSVLCTFAERSLGRLWSGRGSGGSNLRSGIDGGRLRNVRGRLGGGLNGI